MALGLDPVWLGMIIIILIEAALITPLVGLALYAVQSLRSQGRPNDIILGALPFIIAMLRFIVLLASLPGLVLWLPPVLGA